MSPPRLYLSHIAESDRLVALEFGRVAEGQPAGCWDTVGGRFAYLRNAPGGRVVGFVVSEVSSFRADAPEAAALRDGPRFDVPVLGLCDARAPAVIAAARATFGGASTLNRTLLDRAVQADAADAPAWWLACLQTGDGTAHLGLGRALHELGRHTEALRHLRHATEIAPHDPAGWSWRERAATALGEREEAADARRWVVALDAPETRFEAPVHEETPPQTRTLWGDRLPGLGERRVEAIGAHVGLGLTAGAVKKRSGSADPNEDMVAAVAGPRATLLVCADGHDGATSSRVAVEHLLERLGDDPPPADLPDDALVDLWGSVNVAVEAAARDGRQRDSRTTLVLALLAGSRLQWAALGDSMLAVVRGGELVRRLDVPQPVYVGWPMTRLEVAQRVRRGTMKLATGDWVILATDGFVDFARPSAREAILEAVSAGGDAPQVATRLIDAACHGGAGDNVAVATAELPVPVTARPEPDAGVGAVSLRERVRGARLRQARDLAA